MTMDDDDDDETRRDLVPYQARPTEISVPRVSGVVDAAFTHWRARRHKDAYLEIARMLDAKTSTVQAYTRLQREIGTLNDLDAILEDDQAERDDERAERKHQREVNKRRREREAKSWDAEDQAQHWSNQEKVAKAENEATYQGRLRDTTKAIAEHQLARSKDKHYIEAIDQEVRRSVAEAARDKRLNQPADAPPPTPASNDTDGISNILSQVDERLAKALDEKNETLVSQWMQFRSYLENMLNSLSEDSDDA